VKQHSLRGAVVVVGLVALAAVLAATALAAGGAAPLKGRITADGSSTVGPYTTAAAEGFQRANGGVQVTVGISGTGGGFERFCNGETDLSNASRPMRTSEAIRCRDKGIPWVAFTVANDGISIVANKDNTWASCLTMSELRKIWDSGSSVGNWKDVRAGFPDQGMKLFGPGTDSGTFDFFTQAINGREKRSRSDYAASEDDNILVQGVAGERGALGYFGFSYFEENRDKLKLVAVNNGSGCQTPSIASVQRGTYKPLSRPLFVYAKRTSFQRPEVQAFVRYIIDNEVSIAKASGYISLTPRQLKKLRYQYAQAVKRANA
jgi:phosphate transport system substrate-binding protein